jgi:hypothetical protein
VWLGLGNPVRDLKREFRAAELPRGVTDVRVYCGGCLVVGVPGYTDEPEVGSRIASHPAFAGWQLVVVTDEAERATSDMNFLWTTFTRFEPADIQRPRPAWCATTCRTRSHRDRRSPNREIRRRSLPPGGDTVSTAGADFPNGGVEMGDPCGHLTDAEAGRAERKAGAARRAHLLTSPRTPSSGPPGSPDRPDRPASVAGGEIQSALCTSFRVPHFR